MKIFIEVRFENGWMRKFTSNTFKNHVDACRWFWSNRRLFNGKVVAIETSSSLKSTAADQ